MQPQLVKMWLVGVTPTAYGRNKAKYCQYCPVASWLHLFADIVVLPCSTRTKTRPSLVCQAFRAMCLWNVLLHYSVICPILIIIAIWFTHGGDSDRNNGGAGLMICNLCHYGNWDDWYEKEKSCLSWFDMWEDVLINAHM